MSTQPRRLLDEKGQPLFEDVETDQMVRDAFNKTFFNGANSIGDFVLGFRLATSKTCNNEAQVTDFARKFKASRLYCPMSIKTLDELKATPFHTPELVKAVKDGEARLAAEAATPILQQRPPLSERAERRQISRERARRDPRKKAYHDAVAAAKARAQAELAKLQSGKW